MDATTTLIDFDLNAPIPEELPDWEMMEPIRREILPAITADRYARTNE